MSKPKQIVRLSLVVVGLLSLVLIANIVTGKTTTRPRLYFTSREMLLTLLYPFTTITGSLKRVAPEFAYAVVSLLMTAWVISIFALRRTLLQRRRTILALWIAIGVITLILAVGTATGLDTQVPLFYLTARDLFDLLNLPFRLFLHSTHRLVGWPTFLLPFLFLYSSAHILIRDTADTKLRVLKVIWAYGEIILCYGLISIVSNAAEKPMLWEQSERILGRFGGFVLYLVVLVASCLFLARNILGKHWSLAGSAIGLLLRRPTDTEQCLPVAVPESTTEQQQSILEEQPGDRKTPDESTDMDRRKPTIQGAPSEELDLTCLTENPFDGVTFPSAPQPAANGRPESDLISYRRRVEAVISELGLPISCETIKDYPSRYEFVYSLQAGARFSQIRTLSREICDHLGDIHARIEIPIPGTNRIGISVSRSDRPSVRFRNHLEAIRESALPVPVFAGVGEKDGELLVHDIAQYPHAIAAGVTGSGKSMFLNNMICGLLLCRNSKAVRPVLVDPKKVEFSAYSHVPHLACPVVTDLSRMSAILAALDQEMNRRLDLFRNAGHRKMEEWVAAGMEPKLPYILVIVDEYAAVMDAVGASVQKDMVRLASMARAVGIQLIMATQRPSADIIDSAIKANFPVRFAFRTASADDSRVILGRGGAENLLGNGHCVYRQTNGLEVRVWTPYVDVDAILAAGDGRPASPDPPTGS